MPKDLEKQNGGDSLPAAVMDQIVQMVTMIPLADNSDAEVRILEQILSAQKSEDLDSPWNTSGFRSLVNVPVRIHKLSRAESDYKGEGVGWYLFVEGVRLDTGEKVGVTVGSPYVIAQLVKAFNWGDLPSDWRCIEKTTSSGNTALHLEFLGRPVPVAPGEQPF